MRFIFLLAFAVVLATALSAQPSSGDCKTPATFLHLIGEPGKIENISALCAAPDGNLYCSGLKGARTVIGKMNLDGAFLWAYSFVTEPYEPVLVAEIIVDSEGMIVGSGRQGDKHLAKGFAFRYDPATHQMLWAQQFDEGRPVEGGILEKTPGGNYLYYQNPQADSVIRNPEILELARTTGQIVPTFAKRYNLNPFEVAFTSVVAHNQYLYATGYGLGVLGARKMLMAMIDAGTGEVVRASAMNLGWATPSYFTGKDLIVDDTTLVALYHGSETSYTIGDGPGTTTSLFLRKFTLDNKTLWVKKYLFSHPPKELVAVPDGYVMLGGRADRYLLKTDKEGNLLTAKRLDNPPAINNNNGEQQNQLVVLGNHLFMADFALSSSADQYTTLLKTNLNLELDFDCSHYLDYSTSDSMVSDQDANYPLFATASPATQQAVAVSMAVETMTLRETCPVCPDTVICTDKPDISFQIESIGCDSAAFVHYRLCNTGGQPFSGPLHIGVYASNPLTTAAMLLDLFSLQINNLPPDSCQTGTLLNLANWGNNADVYALAGIETGQGTPIDLAGFPYNGIAECDYANNLDSLYFQYDQPQTTREYVLLPGDSVVIDGKTYTSSDTVISYAPSAAGGCDTLVTNIIYLDSLHYNTPEVFLKTFCSWLGRVLVSASDGGYYMGGETPQGKALAKFDATGKNLWVRRFDYFSSNLYFYDLIEDSEGMLVGYATSFAGTALLEMMVFRYDPSTDQMVWVQHLSGFQAHVRGFKIMEKSVGGDYLLVYRVGLQTGNFHTEICTLDRTTGTVPGGQVWRYGPQTSLTSADVHQGYLYAWGELRDSTFTSTVSRGGVMKIDLNTGIPVWANVTRSPLLLQLINGDMIVDNDGNVVSTINEMTLRVCFQKTSPDGELLWFKRFQFSNIPENRFNPMGIARLPDGYLCGIHASSDNDNTYAFIVVKTDTSGNVLWAKRVPNVGHKSYLSPQLLATRNKEAAFATNVLLQMSQQSRMVFGTFDEDGNIADPCQIVEDCSVSLVDIVAVFDPAELSFSTVPRMFAPVTPNPSLPHGLLQNTACTSCLPCDSISVQQIIEFYPGDTVFLAGTPYTQPDTVTLTLTTDDGCDSVVTYFLQRVITTIDLVCPPDQTVSIPANQSSVAVSYPLPAAATDCPNPAVTLTRLQGPPSGGLFPEGTNLVCYEAANQCGVRDTCCFTVTAQQATDEPACDVKIPPGSCIKYELLSIRLDALGRPRYRMRLTNTCASPLRYAYFQLPNSMTAKAPLDGATYTAPGGNTYLVRNPNAAPYRSIRFQPVSGTLNNGKSDIFEYTLPKQAQMAFILVSAKLEDNSSYDAHINTFSCPVQPYIASAQEPADAAQNRNGAAPLPSVQVRPNPTSGLLFVDLQSVSEGPVLVSVLNAQGQLMLEGRFVAENNRISLRLPEGLANGLYFLVVRAAGTGEQASTRFVLER